MPDYKPLERTAERLGTTVETLREFESLGWISTVEKNGHLYMSAHQEYKARFILKLQRVRCLTRQQIGQVLAAQNAPYDFAAIDRIIARQL